MKTLDFWFDVVSPYAYLAFERLPQALEGCSYRVRYRPLLFGALLSHWGQLGPAEFEPKRAWTMRQVHWLAREAGVELALPAQHPFNPLALQRLALACGEVEELPNRRVVEALFHHVWRGGADANDPARLQALTQTLRPALDPQRNEVKGRLRAHTQEAIDLGLFGVPTIALDGKLFWGLDALPMVRAALQGDAWFDGPWQEAARARPGVRRR
ncbi:2-hydroxychromene-2-carboxylate isomerase [Azohydromonas caseinilytica]|uniref:2-hydroxychromene-2-carboxylate isomerase n=1 Tax=Azohydromonas caseinilytica TaxID=2728836 RepID=A0A848F931_9BURK|nr:2-hydroxychromene-2-carboxylate isomerase [Azohydromonas caseinilytica]NML15316.1 2-hydroxychromene-2-carboxylate isomerase [Azohydromonas caseinilytica]